MGKDLAYFSDKIAAGEQLSEDDVHGIVENEDLISIGILADEARRYKHGNRVTFVRVEKLNLEDIQAGSLLDPPVSAGEFRIVGKPQSIETAVSSVCSVKNVSGGKPVTGFLLHELEELSDLDGTSLEKILGRLRDAGLELVVEARVDRLPNPEFSLRSVSDSGLGISRLTIQNTRGFSDFEWVKRVADLEFGVGVVRTFSPLTRIDDKTISTGYDDVKQLAVARLLVNNTESIQVDWALHGPKMAQVALTFGANDVDGISPAESETSEYRRAPLTEIRRNIEAASFIPVERNGRFEDLS